MSARAFINRKIGRRGTIRRLCVYAGAAVVLFYLSAWISLIAVSLRWPA